MTLATDHPTFRAAVISILLFLLLGVSSLAAFENVRINSDATTELQNEEMIVVSPLADSVLLSVWRDFRLGFRRVGLGISHDAGHTWQDSLETVLPLYRSSDPGAAVDRQGNYNT
jgi:hypothetical protein